MAHNELAVQIVSIVCASIISVSATPYPAISSAKQEVDKKDLIIAQSITPRPPCCSDSANTVTCKRMQARDPITFAQRCLNDVDFSLVQCCQSCGIESVEARYSYFFADGEKSQHCFDRHSLSFCKRLLFGTGHWQFTKWTCDAESIPLSFRVCRKTCGFCNPDIYETNKGRYIPNVCGKKAEFVPNFF